MPKKLRLQILSKNQQILRGVNQEIIFPLSKEVKNLIENMKVIVREAPGIGLAAPQVGYNLRLAVINLEEMGVPQFVIINPKIVSKSIKKTEIEEGCLSIPGRFVRVKRPARVEVEAFDENGRKFLIRADHLLAKVIQHEIDHLDSTLIIDKK